MIPQMHITGAGKVKAKFKSLSLKGKTEEKMEVGYTMPYAVYVHENLEAEHPIGQAKFLEQPARMYKDTLAYIVRERLKRKRSLKEALQAAGEFLLEKSRELVPVDTGKLYRSGYVKAG